MKKFLWIAAVVAMLALLGFHLWKDGCKDFQAAQHAEALAFERADSNSDGRLQVTEAIAAWKVADALGCRDSQPEDVVWRSQFDLTADQYQSALLTRPSAACRSLIELAAAGELQRSHGDGKPEMREFLSKCCLQAFKGAEKELSWQQLEAMLKAALGADECPPEWYAGSKLRILRPYSDSDIRLCIILREDLRKSATEMYVNHTE